jgi:hypothetical protein
MPAVPALAVFCDFDGTFARQDVGSTLAARYAADRRPAQWARFERGEITAWEYNLEILEGLPVDEDVLETFLATVELDPGARSLLAWCEQRSVPFRILSDGFDRNLDRLQTLNGVRFAYTANHLRLEYGKWRISAAACRTPAERLPRTPRSRRTRSRKSSLDAAFRSCASRTCTTWSASSPRSTRALRASDCDRRAVTVPPCRRSPDACWWSEPDSPASPRPGVRRPPVAA